jgi:8-oxo-dGTP pyrophosphatase MutT (NUDIX family)
MSTAPATEPVVPRPAASVVLVRDAPPGAPEPIEVYMIRRHRTMKFLGGFYAFPGGKVDPADSSPASLAACRGISVTEAAGMFPGHGDLAPLAFWMTAVRELLEESGILLACDATGLPIDARSADVAAAITESRRVLMAAEAPFAEILARAGWHCDLRALRYLSHFITPRSSPIRFTARFFLCRVPGDQAPVLFTEETSEGFWIHPGEGYRRFLAGEMAMAEPAEYGLGWIAQFRSVDELWQAHADNQEKFCGILDRIEFWKDFDWKANRFPERAKR